MFSWMLNFVRRLYCSSTYRITVELLRYGFYQHEYLDVFITVLTPFITTSTATIYTRDRLLPLGFSTVQLNQQVRLQVSQLRLRRRGCRAGRHRHR